MRFQALAFLLLLPALALGDDFDSLRLRWRQTLTGGTPDATLPAVQSKIAAVESTAKNDSASLVRSANRTALWTDIASTTVSADISSNYGRLRDMAIGWATPGQSQYQSAPLLADILAGMDWMDANRYNSKTKEYDNWWDFEIGSPGYVVDIAILLYDQLTPDQLNRYMAAVDHFDSDPRIMIVNTVSTGANLADKCRIALLRGILIKDSTRVQSAVTYLSPVFAYVTSTDGFYADGSFIQHTKHPYTGSYGLVLLTDIANLLALLAGSPWDVKDPGRANVSKWISDSFTPLLYEGAMMNMVMGRAISRTSSPDHGIGHSTIAAMLRYIPSAAPAEAAVIQSWVKRWLVDDTSRDYSSGLALDQITATRHLLDDSTVAPAELPYSSRIYASMDRVVHLRPTWAAGIAMHSTRIYNYESINNENLHGWHTGDGMLYLYNSDLTQFADIFWPTVDPQRLPGTTVIAGSQARQSQTGGSNAVGGAALDSYSSVMMYLQPDGGQLKARKSWFLFDDEIVALGADIRSTAAGQAVETVVENRRLSSGSVFSADPGGTWAHLAAPAASASIGYVFPNGPGWTAQQINTSGSWKDINAGYSATVLSAPYETIWFSHGIAPTAGSYSYVLLPGKTKDQTAAYAANPAVTVIQNDANAQAVSHAGLGLRAANFWAAATSNGIKSDSIASVLMHEGQGLISVAVADPTQTNTGTIHLELNISAVSLVSADPGVTVDQLSPTLRLSFAVKGTAGAALKITLRTTVPPAGAGTPVMVSAASYGPTVAPDMLASLYGMNLGWRLVTATSIPWPTALNGTSLTVTDSAGVSRSAALVLTAPGQVNFVVPPGTATGAATFKIAGTPVGTLSGSVTIQAVAPGIFTADASGHGVPAALASRFDNATQKQTGLPVFTCNSGCTAAPIALDGNSTVYLSLYGTGIRGTKTNVTCTIGGVSAPVLYAGAQGSFAGLDQVNIQLPPELAGRGDADLVLTVDGIPANTVTLKFQ